MYDLLVVGAGPYGLSIASHAAAAGLSLRVHGRPMASWRDHMPPGMFLKSEPWASNLSDPEGRWRLDVYCAQRGVEARHGLPIPVGTFASYGLWFARNAVPPVDERVVARVQRRCGGFEAVLADGEVVRARTVVLAVGVLPFVEVPPVLRQLPDYRVSHSSHHHDLGRFRGMDVTVIGGGQAALETAALLAEQGTRARVLARSPPPLERRPTPLVRPLRHSVRSPHSGLGCGWRNWFYAERPGWYRRLPEARRVRVASEALGPAGAWWVRDRVERTVEVLLGQEVAVAHETGDVVRLETVGRGGELTSLDTEHVIAATGFRAGCDRLDLLAPEVRADLVPLSDGSPAVGRDFESTVPGLFLAGLTTAAGFGPAMRFVHGASFTAPTLVRGVRRRLRSGVPGGRIPVPGAWADLASTAGS
ncbi:NAD(P)-binding domain-containing protein [Streptomyces sp. MNU76]|uniref:NAD(P)-binding domain-containing protein n=1 Tax=Streptomyces sp. MNU76 TaxID=2560026 RepID=UPI001E637C7F|nr:NAD(P)-binding domain-containing protein [Streptomyces sp. MNU76]MCC9704135.1 NAD(P)-binding domain-containing protein [Streptomyces sp. MNU76]